MNHKVLLADDSLTIQKVIKITLANQPYDITECSSEEELFQKLPQLEPKIVFLDINLSSQYTGYELCSKIKAISPSAKVLMLLGTFDNIDDVAFKKCGASDKIVKPFDSNKFIAICKQLIEASEDNEDLDYPEVQNEIEDQDQDVEDQWQMTTSTDMAIDQGFDSAAIQEQPVSINALNQEISDWGMSVPGVISEGATTTGMMELPPVMEANPVEISKPDITKPDIKFPANDDLDYPDMGKEVSTPEFKEPEKKSKLLSLETFNDIPLEIELDNAYHFDETDVASIEDQIRDEVEQDLWQADEFEDLKREVSDKIGEMKNNFQPSMKDFDEALFKPLDEGDSIKWTEPETASFETHQEEKPSMDHLQGQLEELVKKYVKEYMDQMFKQNVEKISWEVIPDLAENLIRQELGKISNKIINDQ